MFSKILIILKKLAKVSVEDDNLVAFDCMLPNTNLMSYFLVDKTEYSLGFDFSVLSDKNNQGYSQAIKQLSNKLLVCLEGDLIAKYSQFEDTPLEILFLDDSLQKFNIMAT